MKNFTVKELEELFSLCKEGKAIPTFSTENDNNIVVELLRISEYDDIAFIKTNKIVESDSIRFSLYKEGSKIDTNLKIEQRMTGDFNYIVSGTTPKESETDFSILEGYILKLPMANFLVKYNNQTSNKAPFDLVGVKGSTYFIKNNINFNYNDIVKNTDKSSCSVLIDDKKEQTKYKIKDIEFFSNDITGVTLYDKIS